MQSESLTISLSNRAAASTGENWVRLEQPPVNTARLSRAGLLAMLALVQTGTSAHAYRQSSCPASVNASTVTAPLELWAWPSDQALPYSLACDLVTEVAPVEVLRLERDFDLIVPMATSVDLPFFVEQPDFSWATPCYNRFGAEVPRPTITHTGSRIDIDAEVFGVIRLRCIAIGRRHRLSLSMAKTIGQAIVDLKPAATATWVDADGGLDDERIELKLPACVTDLLATCADGSLVRDNIFNVEDTDDLVPVLYYSTCDGQVQELRYERP